jgi:hypothetical protein
MHPQPTRQCDDVSRPGRAPCMLQRQLKRQCEGKQPRWSQHAIALNCRCVSRIRCNGAMNSFGPWSSLQRVRRHNEPRKHTRTPIRCGHSSDGSTSRACWALCPMMSRWAKKRGPYRSPKKSSRRFTGSKRSMAGFAPVNSPAFSSTAFTSTSTKKPLNSFGSKAL